MKDWLQADFVEVIYVLSDVLPYITELSLVFQELEFDTAIVQVLVNHCLSSPERSKDDSHHGMENSLPNVIYSECKPHWKLIKWCRGYLFYKEW